MKSVSQFTALLTAAVLTAGVQAETNPSQVGDFALLDHEGEFHHLSRYGYKEALVIFSQANSCSNADAVADLRELRSEWQDQGVQFLMLNASAEDSLESVRSTVEQQDLDFPVMMDRSQLVAETLEITQAGEVIILEPETQNLVYRGPVHEHIGMILEDVVAGKADEGEMAPHVMDVEGCDLSFPAKVAHENDAPDYAEDVAPILKDQCADCHREGGIGPFAMESYNMVRGWSPMIQEVLLTKRMPPMQVDPSIGHFTNANYISSEELQTLVHWIEAGAPRGDSEVDPLTEIEAVDRTEWQLGEPDYVVEAPTHQVPATGVLDYINIDIDLPFEEDKWVKAVQFIPGDPEVLHHLLAYVTEPQEGFEGEEGQSDRERSFLEGYAPGKVDAMTFPESTGVHIPEGDKLSMQFHYTTNGKATEDTTLVGLYFHDEPPKHKYLNYSLFGDFKVPPHDPNYNAAGEHVFEDPVMIYGLRAHMHFRGKDMQFAAEFPDGTRKELLNVPDYSYAWQPTYALEEPQFLPAGTKVYVTGSFDNSEFNPANPDPSKELTFGLQSWDEMFIGYWSYHKVDPEDVPEDVAKN